MIDNSDVNRILEKLENHDDEDEAVALLKEFNAASTLLGKLLFNLDKALSHDKWKHSCDEARKQLDKIVAEIDAL